MNWMWNFKPKYIIIIWLINYPFLWCFKLKIKKTLVFYVKFYVFIIYCPYEIISRHKIINIIKILKMQPPQEVIYLYHIIGAIIRNWRSITTIINRIIIIKTIRTTTKIKKLFRSIKLTNSTWCNSNSFWSMYKL